MAGKYIGGIRFGVSMDTQKLKKDAKGAQGMLGKFVQKSRTIMKGFAVAVAGATAAFGVMVKQQLAAVDSLAKVSSKLGVATGRLAGLRHAAKQTGIAGATLDMALQRMVRRISEANVGLGEAQNAIKELGLSAQELNRLAPDAQFAAIADAMRKVENPADKLRLAFKLFDSEGAALVNTLALGSTGLERMHREAKALGLAISQADAKEIERANDAIDRLMKVLMGFARSMAVEIAPAIIAAVQTVAAVIEPDATKRVGGRHKKDSAAELLAGLRLGHSAKDRLRNGPSGTLWYTDRGPRSTGPGVPNQFNQRNYGRTLPPQNVNFPQRDERLGRQLLGFVSSSINSALTGLQSGAGRGQFGLLNLLRQGEIAKGTLRDSRLNNLPQNASSGSRGNLSLTEAGSAESYRLRARIRKAAEGERLDKERNKSLTAIKNAITQNPFVVMEAGLGG